MSRGKELKRDWEKTHLVSCASHEHLHGGRTGVLKRHWEKTHLVSCASHERLHGGRTGVGRRRQVGEHHGDCPFPPHSSPATAAIGFLSSVPPDTSPQSQGGRPAAATSGRARGDQHRELSEVESRGGGKRDLM